MTITANNNTNGNVVIFRWDNELTECGVTTGGVPFDEVENLIDRMMLVGTHEGNDYKGWTVTVSN